MKKFLIIFLTASLLSFVFLGVGSTSAQENNPPETGTPNQKLDYEPLAPLPGVPADQNVSLASYLTAMFRLFLGLAAVMAVLMIVVGGFQYMTTDAIQDKKDGKERIKNALWGLVLALAAVLILETVNPKLLEFNLELKKLETESEEQKVVEKWSDDDEIRQKLNDAGVRINKPNCDYVGQKNCTSLVGLPPFVINRLSELRSSCGQSLGLEFCGITITGGTEYWLHKTHGPGKAVLDISSSGQINSYVTGKDGPVDWTCFQRETINGITFQWEGSSCEGSTGNHWHLIF